MSSITEYAMNRALTIVFHNNSCAPPTLVVWVCRNKEAMDKALERLKAMDHISIAQAGPSHVEGEVE